MPHHRELREVPYRPDQMHALVVDIARYPEFLPWVLGMRVRGAQFGATPDQRTVRADMIVGFKGLRETLSCTVTAIGDAEIHVDYVDGPLSHLTNRWRFLPAASGGCLVDFTVDFAFRSRMFEMLAGQVFERALTRMIRAFEDRAAVLYGAGNTKSSSVAANGSPGISRPSANKTA